MTKMAAEFEPKFYTAGPTRFYLPLLQDIVTEEKPGLTVTVGLGDGQAHLAMCQIATENSLPCRFVAVRRGGEDEPAQQGLRIVWAPQASLVHHESGSRGRQFSEEQKLEFRREAGWMQERWGDKLMHDPFYNPNLSLSEEGGFTLAWPPRLPPLGVSLNAVTADASRELF
jgi:hypothetical protein